jgi:hypothetical protein
LANDRGLAAIWSKLDEKSDDVTHKNQEAVLDLNNFSYRHGTVLLLLLPTAQFLRAAVRWRNAAG